MFAQEAVKLSLMGVTILAASGDQGVANYGGSYCDRRYPAFVDNCACIYDSSSDNNIEGVVDSQSKNVWSGVGYFPNFPATCPYVTAVGGTQLDFVNSGPEVTCSSSTGGAITSGGGFSTYYSALNWQNNSISQYFTTVAKEDNYPTSGYNNLGRGFPDVSMNAVDYNVILGGKSTGVYGTSASAPVFAALCKWYITCRVMMQLALFVRYIL